MPGYPAFLTDNTLGFSTRLGNHCLPHLFEALRFYLPKSQTGLGVYEALAYLWDVVFVPVVSSIGTVQGSQSS